MAEAGSELVRIEGAEGLSGMQARFVEMMLEGVAPEEARARAGYSEKTPTVSILSGKLVQNAISAACEAQLRGPLKLKALKTLATLLDSGPAATKFNAAKMILEYGQDDEGHDEKPLSEMTVDELEAVIRRKEAELKDVTPKNGAQR